MSKTARFRKFAGFYTYSYKAQGFTLLELLIVVTIIVSITAAVVPSFSGYIRNQGVRQAAEQVKSDLRSAQNKALTGALSDQTVNSNPVAYWGVRFSPNSNRYEYFISDTATSCPVSFSTGQSQGYTDLPADINVRSTGYKCLYFSMANGGIVTSGFGTTNSVVVGYADTNDEGDCRSVLFNTSGLIYIGTSQICT